jgi:hypothetical protein
MGYVQYGHQTDAERAADERQREALETIKEIGQWQAVIVLQLQMLVRGHPPDAIRQRIAEASREYGERLTRLLEEQPRRIAGPKR